MMFAAEIVLWQSSVDARGLFNAADRSWEAAGRYAQKAVGESRGGEMSGVLPMLQYVRALLSCPAGPCPFSEQVLASGRWCQPERAVSNQRWGRADCAGCLGNAEAAGGGGCTCRGRGCYLLSRDECVGGFEGRVWIAHARATVMGGRAVSR